MAACRNWKLRRPNAEKKNKGGDFLAVLVLFAFLAGMGWLWWKEKHPEKPIGKETVKSPAATVQKAPAKEILPPPLRTEKAPEQPPANSRQPTNAVPEIKPPSQPIEVKPEAAAVFPRPARSSLEIQIALARLAISPGSIDGAVGSQTRAALEAFQRVRRLVPTGYYDTNTESLLSLDAPLFTNYIVTSNDLGRLQPLGKTWLAKSQQSALDYETILELVAEKAHSNPHLIEKLNPEIDWTKVVAGTALKIPDVVYPEPADKAAFVVIRLSNRYLEAFDTDSNLMAHFPCSIAAKVDKRPVGELHVAKVAPNPNYTFDPAIFTESPEAQAIGRKLILPPGPNNPVGVAWIGLDKPGYGMHGTPSPELIGRTESHGCFRLANWDAAYLLKLVWIGMPVYVEP